MFIEILLTPFAGFLLTPLDLTIVIIDFLLTL